MIEWLSKVLTFVGQLCVLGMAYMIVTAKAVPRWRRMVFAILFVSVVVTYVTTPVLIARWQYHETLRHLARGITYCAMGALILTLTYSAVWLVAWPRDAYVVLRRTQLLAAQVELKLVNRQKRNVWPDVPPARSLLHLRIFGIFLLLVGSVIVVALKLI